METMANSMMEASGILGTATSAGSERETAKRCSAIVEHQGGTRILHQPDGTIVCEPAAMSFSSGASGPVIGERHCGLELARCAAGRAVQLGMLTCQAAVIVGSAVGGWTSVLHVSHAMCQNQPVNVKRMAGDAAAAVGCCVAATLGGVVAGPVVAAGSALRLAVRPALLAGAVHCSWGWLRRHHVGAAALLRKLQSGELSKQLEALREVVARAATNPAFRQEWAKLSGVEAVLQLLARALATAQAGASLLGSPQAPLAARALAELAVDGDAVDTIVEAGGVSLLVKAAQLGFEGGMPTTTAASAAAGASTLLMLDAANLLMTDKLPSVSCDGSSSGAKAAQAAAPSHVPLVVHALHALSRVASSHAVAQQLLASEPGAGPLLAGVLRAATAGLLLGGSPAACAALRGDVICLMHALALEPAGKASLGDAGAVEALAAALTLSTPWSHDQADAAAALHAVVRGDPANQRRLAAAAAAGVSAAISRTLNMSPAVAAASAANSPMARSSHNDTFAADAPVLGSAAAAGGKAAARQRGSRAHGPPTGSSMLLAGPMVHAARADLVALSHVIARYTPPTLSAPVTTAAAPPPATVAAAAAAAAAPTRTAFLQRLRLRTSRPPAAPAAAAAAAPIVAPVSSTRAPSSPLTRTPANSSTRRSSMTEAAGTVLPAAAVEDAAAGAAAAVLPAAAERADNHTTSDQEWEDDVCVGDSAESSENERAASPELPLRVQ